MAKLNRFKRINVEDVDDEFRDLAETLGFSINGFADSVYEAFDGNINFDNLNQKLVTITVEQKTTDKVNLIGELKFKTNLKTRAQGILCISAQNLIDSTLVTSTPFIMFTEENSMVTIQSIIGLPIDKKFKLTLLLIGN